MSIELTTNAANRIREYAAEGTLAAMRFGIKKMGCSGYSYVVEMDDVALPDDVEFESEGVIIRVNKEDLSFIDGTKIDFVQDGFFTSFHFSNPNESGSCGCGESFTVG